MIRKAVFLVLTILFAISLSYGQGSTPNMGLSLPARGTLNWDVQMRANFSTIDLFYGYMQTSFQGPWSNSITYQKGQQVASAGALYSSLVGNNLNNPPASSPLSWILMVSTGAGTVSSVGLTVPAEFSVSGSPITGSGTFGVTKANQSANTFWGGPCTGSPAVSGFRVLCATDIPNITESQVTGLTSDLAAKAPVDSPTFTTTAAAPTPSTGDNSTKVATTAFVKNQNYVTAATAPVTTVAGRTGAITLAEGDLNLTDVTTNDASITKHGFLKKLPNNAALFLDGTGAFSSPAGGISGSGTTGFIPYWTGSTALGNSPMVRADANTMEQRNGANPQTLKLYSSYTDASNNAGLSIAALDVGTGGIRIRSFANGSGSPVDMVIDTCSGCGFSISENGTAKTQFAGGLVTLFGGRFTGFGTPGLVWIGGQPVNVQGTTTALPATNIFINAPVGMYEIKGYLVITTAGTSGGIAVNALYTDETGSQTMVLNTLANVGLLDSKLSFSGVFRSDGAIHNIQLSTTFNTVVGSPTYSIYAVCTQLMNQ